MSDDVRRYIVTTADPEGYWLMQHCDIDPRSWVYMDQPSPITEIDRLRARIAELEAASVKEVLDFGVEQLNRGHNKYFIFDEEMIDHAWSFRETDPNGCIDAAMSCLGVLPCEKCDGHGSWTYERDCQEFEAVVKEKAHCPACHRNGKSHGWMWKGADDE